MKTKKLLLFLFFLYVMHLFTTNPIRAQQTTLQVTVSNIWNKPKSREPIVIKMKDLGLSYEPKSAVVYDGKEELPSQLDDVDGDGKTEDLAFMINISAQTKKNLTVILSAKKSEKKYKPQVYAEMLLSGGRSGSHQPIRSLTVLGGSDVYDLLHHHGPAFESELVAFRTYFDARQSIDIYGKQHKQLELETTRFYPTLQQIQEGYGDDVLWAGSSVGLGSLRGIKNGKLQLIEPVDERTECIRAYGPVRTVIEIIDKGWEYQGKKLDMTCRYILYGGHRDLQIQLRFEEPLKNESFCTGLIKLDNAEIYNNRKGLSACWGENWPYSKNDTLNHPKATIGLGLYIPEKYVLEEPKDEQNILYTFGADGKKKINYYVAFCSKREDFGYADAQEWFAFIEAWEQNLSHPVEITVKQ